MVDAGLSGSMVSVNTLVCLGLLLAALGWSLAILSRLRDWRMILPAAFFAVLTAEKLPGVIGHLGGVGPLAPPRWAETPSVLVGALGFFGIAAVGWMFEDERRLRAQAMELGDIVEKTPDFVGIASLDGKAEYVNSPGRQLVGIRPDEDIGGRPIQAFHPDWVNQLMESETLPAARKLGSWRGVSALLHRDGHEIPCLQVLTAHFDDAGQLRKYSTVMRDLSDVPQRSDSIRERETRFRLLTEQVPAIVWSCNRNLVITSAFGAGLATVDLEPERLLGSRVGDHPGGSDQGPRIIEAHLRALGHRVEIAGDAVRMIPGEPLPGWEHALEPFEACWRDRWFRGFIRPLRDQAGKVVGTVGVALDIHEQRLAQEKASERQARLNLIAERVPAILWSTDREACLTSLFGAGLEAFGIAGEDLLGTRLADRIPPGAAREAALRVHDKVLEEGAGAFERDVRGRRLQVFMQALEGPEGEAQGTVGIAFDITELRRTQADLAASQADLRALAARLERVREQERRSLARDIHDELGQVLTALRMELKGWLDDLPSHLPEDVIRAATHVELVDAALLQVRKISQRLRPPELDELGLLEAIRCEIEEFGRRARVKCVLRDDIGEMPPHFDRDSAFFRILRESLTNVARHAGASTVEVRLARENGTVRLDVLDNGCGLDAKDIAGDTLGLRGMRERAVALGGELQVARRERGGTAVRVKLPIDPGGSR